MDRLDFFNALSDPNKIISEFNEMMALYDIAYQSEIKSVDNNGGDYTYKLRFKDKNNLSKFVDLINCNVSVSKYSRTFKCDIIETYNKQNSVLVKINSTDFN